MKLGEIIRKWRLVTEADLRATAREIGISHSTLYRIERGETCDSKNLTKVLAWVLSEGVK